MNEPQSEAFFEEQRQLMVDEQIAARGIRDERVLAAMRQVPRHRFVPDFVLEQAYDDGPLPIGWDQTISQPYIVAYMTEILNIRAGDRVLEVGTGSGYQCAVLAELTAEVFSIEMVEPLYIAARERLRTLGYRNIHFRHGDGSRGWPEAAPFDKIIVTAAAGHVPAPLIEQLAEGGRLIVPVGQFSQTLMLGEKQHGIFQTSETIPVRFVPLVEGKEKKQRGQD